MDQVPSTTHGLTDEQSRPLDVRGVSVALSAGAGCGKTTVLTARFLGHLDGPDRRPLREIVALTFTRKAVRELRQRIRAKCREKLAAGDDPAHWRAVLRGLEAAPIGTFHEFCGQWLRRHAIEAGIDLDFAILDESIAGAVRDEALASCLRRWLGDCDPDLIELAVEFGLGRVRQSLAELLAQRALGEIDEWAARTADDLISIWQSVWMSKGREARFRKVIQAAQACVEWLAPHESTHSKMCERRGFLLERLPDLGPIAPSDDCLSEIKEMAKVQGAGNGTHWPTPEIYEGVKDAFAGLRKAIEDFRENSQWDENATREAAEHGLRFARLALKARHEYDAAKRTRGGLDFDDLILKTRALLRARPKGQEPAPDEAIARLLVDEFQDTDPVQSEILERLGGAAFAQGKLFLVGDLKQSIYRFRGAQPTIFQTFSDRFPIEGRHALTENFRSVPGVLDFINALFAKHFGEDSRLFPDPRSTSFDSSPAIEFLWAAETEDDARSARSPVHDRRNLEARWIARRIRQLLASGRMVRDKATGQARVVEPKDIVLLFRAMTSVGEYERALDDEGLDHHLIGGSAFYAQQEVHDLINLLSVIEDPCDAVSLAGALRGPFFCLSDEGLFWLATSKHGDLVEGLERFEEIAELAPLDRPQADRARELLHRWRGIKDRVSIAALVDRVLDESGYEAALLGEFLGARKRANVRKLVRLAREFDRQGGFTIAAFVARLRAYLRRPPREEQAATTDEEGKSVRLMSVHQAKGLEFPIVILPDLNRKPSGSDRDAVAFHPALGPLVRPSKDLPDGDEAGTRRSLGWLVYQAIEQRDEEDEALRLFYVATTRARDVLILSAGLGPAEKPVSPAMILLDERFDRRTGNCRATLPDGWPAPRIEVTRECPPAGAERPRRGGWLPPLDEIAKTITTSVPAEVPRSSPARRPRFVDLDPALGLSPHAARLDRLVRTILADPKVFEPGQLSVVASRAARRQDPLAPPRLVAEAVDRLRPWLEVAFGRELANAPAIERNLAWTVAWPPDSADPIVFQGRIDLLARDRHGDWRLVLVSDATASEARAQLRLVLSAHAAAAFGFGPIRQAWHLRLGPGGGVHGEERFAPADIEVSVQAYLSDQL